MVCYVWCALDKQAIIRLSNVEVGSFSEIQSISVVPGFDDGLILWSLYLLPAIPTSISVLSSHD
jgi:hypothetical protein